MNKAKTLYVILVIAIVILGGLCCFFYRDIIRMNSLLNVASAIGGRYCYIGRDLESEERLNGYVQFDSNSLSFDTYDEQKEYYQKVFDMDEERWEDFSENYGNYQVHIICASVDNYSNDTIKNVVLHCIAPNALMRNDTFYFRPVNIGPQGSFSNEIAVLVDASNLNEAEVLELLSSLTISYETQTLYGTCGGRLMFCSDVDLVDRKGDMINNGT